MKKNTIKMFINELVKITKNKSKSLHEPNFSGEEIKYLTKAIKNKSVSTYGKETYLFEQKLKNVTKSKNVISIINGTYALYLSMYSIGVNKSSEVLIPALNYIASTNAAQYLGATPHFIDVEESTLGVDFEKLNKYLQKNTYMKSNRCINKKSKRHIKALILTHVFGHPANMDQASKICKKYKLILIEDAAEALGSFYKKRHLGTFGKLGVLSFNGNKIITTGGGGAILTNDNKLAKKINHISRNARIKKNYWEYAHDQLGFNLRLPSINAHMGIAQLKSLNNFIKNKRKLFHKYKNIFKKYNDFEVFQEKKFSKSNYWLNCIILKKPNKKKLKEIIKLASMKKIQLRPVWRILTQNTHLKKYPSMSLVCAKKLESRILNIPSSSDL
tara:strand:+ start:85 stop:1245 length:1161 start_codon:yes stop_codon:yes gene_type:complete